MPVATASRTHGLPTPTRDPRLDFCRGLLQIFIFISHVEGGWLVYAIPKSWGFSDSSELFVFLSGFTLGSVYARREVKAGRASAIADLARRIWALYAKHLLLALALLAAFGVARRVAGPWEYLDSLRFQPFFADPAGAVAPLLGLVYQPVYLDILPLFVALMAMLPAFMALPERWGWARLAPSAALYAIIWATEINLPSLGLEDGWSFDPLAWQFLFCLGALLGRRQLFGEAPRWPRWLVVAAWALVLAAIPVRVSWTLNGVWDDFPTLLADALWPLDKSHLSPLLMLHALALALVVGRSTRMDHPFYAGAWARPFVWCGRQSLDVFCCGIIASLLVSAELRALGGGVAWQLALHGAGVAALVGWARISIWMKGAGA